MTEVERGILAAVASTAVFAVAVAVVAIVSLILHIKDHRIK